ncbi:protein Skeletor, isoforms B/C-like [Ostrinia furnacalis]|uniref:protein Skeletor, isoforms B/C-like n=1 Tax=Ostrinia furnacalis TaxID=93504 RepID=UPI00103F4A14|nr:protein Skeletor, isoforms B/C-like [Ostrinia furnacalis]
MCIKWFILLAVIAQDCSSQDEDGPYRGKYIGKLNSYHHQVSGEVYAVDEWTIILVNFNYDGTGDDTFFWAGDAGRPGPQGFIVPDEHGKTNILERYYNQDVRLTLPEGKRISRIKWLAVYDIASQNAFGDVYVPDDFESPAPRTIGPLVGERAVSSESVLIADASTIIIPEFKYDGTGEEVYFWTGVGPQPSSRGIKIPDDYGYLEPLRAYKGEDVRLTLPGGRTVFDIKWLSVYDLGAARSLAAVLVPDALNVPPAPLALHPYRTNLPHCKQLHRDYQVSWEKFGNQITIELAARIDENEYMGFGISGSDSKTQMLGADLAVAYYDAKMQRALATDYNVTAIAPCVQVLGQWRGVCRDELLGGLDSNQVFSGEYADGLARVSYRRVLKPFEELDREWVVDKPVFVVWAVGARDADNEPAFHRLHPARDVMLNLDQNPPVNDCYNFTVGSNTAPTPWEVAELFDPSLRVFTFRLGPAAGAQGGSSTAPTPWEVAELFDPSLRVFTFRLGPAAGAHGGSSTAPTPWEVAELFDPSLRVFTFRLGPAAGARGGSSTAPTPWEVAELFDPSLRVFTFRLGPAAGARGLAGRGRAAPALAWYVNGQLAPDLQLRRGLKYSFKVYGGNNPHSATEYHPLIVTASPLGGLERLPDAEQRAARVLAGVHYPRRGRLAPTAAGPLCIGRHAAGADRRRDADYATFRAFNRSLQWDCPPAAPAELLVAPNSSWPDIVYYNSFTHAGMGGRIFVVDRHRRNLARRPASSVQRALPLDISIMLVLAAAAVTLWRLH